MIIDAHCHAWRHWPYQPPVPDPESRGSAAQLLWEMDQSGVDRAIVICAAIGGNPHTNEDNLAAARNAGGRLVPFADVDSRWSSTHHVPGAPGRFAQVLDRLQPLGVTHYLDESADASWLLGEEGAACLSMLEERGVILSLACGPTQMAVVGEAAARHPGLAILVHHMGRARAGDAEALACVLAAASCPNVHVKLSGFGYGVPDPWAFPYPAMQDAARALRDAYGAGRLCWGSDYPVVRKFMTYRQSLEIVRSLCRFLDAGERAQILGGTMGGLLARAAHHRSRS